MSSASSTDRISPTEATKPAAASPSRWIFLALVAVLWPLSAGAKVFLTTEEALALAFPRPCEIVRGTVFLTAEQLERASELAGEKISSSLIHPYVARCGGELSGTAYLDTHRVRSLAETLMVIVDRDGKLSRTEILEFREPEEYIPREIWYEQFEGEPLSGELALEGKIRNVTGATLTARATTEAVRRVLAIHQVLQETQSKEEGSDARVGEADPQASGEVRAE